MQAADWKAHQANYVSDNYFMYDIDESYYGMSSTYGSSVNATVAINDEGIVRGSTLIQVNGLDNLIETEMGFDTENSTGYVTVTNKSTWGILHGAEDKN